MCGILGIWTKNNLEKEKITDFSRALATLSHRGPDYQAHKMYSNCILGHTRLSIIDTDARSNQPFLSEDARFALVYNGEIYNYQALRDDLVEQGINFNTTSDTEVLFHLLKLEGAKALTKLNGFFAFAFYDSVKDELLIARDKMGIKPLYFYEDVNGFVFASELNAINELNRSLTINTKSLNAYFGLTYFTENHTIYNGLVKLTPGSYISVNKGVKTVGRFSDFKVENSTLKYQEATKKLTEILTKSVTDRMVADVPLGSFLSGGLDSSIIAALAIKNNPELKTFSIGFDHAYFNESNYADEVAKHIGSKHFKYVLTKNDFKENFPTFLKSIDEPFADSSAFAVYLLSKHVKSEVTVALSGDGADELFGGYRKHFADFKIRKMGATKSLLLKSVAKSLQSLKMNRSSKWGEANRKLQKLSVGLNLNHQERYIKWCQFIDADERQKLLLNDFNILANPLSHLEWGNLNSVLLADQQLVLPNDMLKKVDLMSMAHGLEVRTPFLDAAVVDFANSLPIHFKIDKNGGKKILRDAFKHLLPNSVLNRPKKGFEIPLKEWLDDEISEILNGPLFTQSYLVKQGLFRADYIQNLQLQWNQPNFGDRVYMVWALIVFQHWWDRNYRTA